MLYEDRMEVATPEGVTLHFTLAGVGSRVISGMLDLLVQATILFGLWLVSLLLSLAIEEWAFALLAVGLFLVLFGYDITFETLASGRTPGKRWTGLRVVRVGGGPVTFRTSAVRNLLRIIDSLPFAYIVGMIAISSSAKNQRLGDIAAGTLVVRERTAVAGSSGVPLGAAEPGEDPSWAGWSAPASLTGPQFETWDVSAVTAEEVATVREFLARRSSLEPDARKRLALELANRLRPKVVAPEERMGPEGFLEQLLAAKSERG